MTCNLVENCEKKLPVEESLGQGGNERDLDDKSYQRFKGSKHRERIIEQNIGSWERATTMKTGHAEHQGSKRRERVALVIHDPAHRIELSSHLNSLPLIWAKFG